MKTSVDLAVPMVHWPEVMVTYDSTEKVLLQMDLENLAHWMWKKTGMISPGLWENMAPRCRIC